MLNVLAGNIEYLVLYISHKKISTLRENWIISVKFCTFSLFLMLKIREKIKKTNLENLNFTNLNFSIEYYVFKSYGIYKKNTFYEIHGIIIE